MRVNLQPAYILHSRPYRDTSLLIEAFSRDHGRVGLVARGARGARRRNPLSAGHLQPFGPVLLSWTGQGELATLTGADRDPGAPAARLRASGEGLLCGLYANELLLRLLARSDPHPGLFDDYDALLGGLASGDPAPVLRRFEKRLLEALGYGLSLTHTFDTGEAVEPGRVYCYFPDRGATQGGQAGRGTGHDGAVPVSGDSLLALAAERFEGLTAQAQSEIRRLTRAALDLQLGERPLHTRGLLRESRKRGRAAVKQENP